MDGVVRFQITDNKLYGLGASFSLLLIAVGIVSFYLGSVPSIFIAADDYLNAVAPLFSVNSTTSVLDPASRQTLLLMQSFLFQFLLIELISLVLVLVLLPKAIAVSDLFVLQTQVMAAASAVAVFLIVLAPHYSCEATQYRCNSYRAHRLLVGAGLVLSALLPSIPLLAFCFGPRD